MRVFNFRSFLVCAVFSAAAVIAGVLFYAQRGAFYVVVPLITAAIIYLLLSSVKRRDTLKTVSYILALLFFAASLSGTLFTSYGWKNGLSEGTHTYLGTVSSVSFSQQDGEARVFIKDLYQDGQKLDGNMSLTVSQKSGAAINFMRPGDEISFSSEAWFNDLYKDGIPNGYYYLYGLRYGARISETELDVYAGTADFFDQIKISARQALISALGDLGETAYGMITGEKGFIESDVRNYYSASGLGHILSVSGLHVGFLSAALIWFLRKVKAGRLTQLAAVSLALLFYCFIASFSAPVIRASVMCVIGLSALIFGSRPDTLNALGLSSAAILAVKPLYLFEAGFLMSSLSTLGIILFYSTFNSFLLKFIPFLRKFCSAAAVSAAAQIGITPIMLLFFGVFPTYSVIVNIIAVPLLTFAFLALILVLPLCMIFPQTGIILNIAGFPLFLTDKLAYFAASLPFSQIRIFTFGVVMLCYPLQLIASRFFMLPKLKKTVSAACAVIIATIILLPNIPPQYDGRLFAAEGYRQVMTVICDGGSTYAVGDMTDIYALDQLLTKARIRKIDRLYLNNLDGSAAAAVNKLASRYNVKKVFAPGSGISGIKELDADTEFYALNKTEFYDGILFPVYSENGIFLGYEYGGNTKVLILAYSADLSAVPETFLAAKIVRAAKVPENADNSVYIVNYSQSGEQSIVTIDRNVLDFNLINGGYRFI